MRNSSATLGQPPDDRPVRLLGAWDLLPGYRLDLCQYSGRAARFGSHHHESSDLSIVLRGRVHERVGRRTSSGLGFYTSFKPAGLEHSDRFEGEVEILRLRIAPRELGETSEAGCSWIVEGWRWRRDLGRRLLRLAREARAGAMAPQLDEEIIELQALLGSPEKASACVPGWMPRLEELIEDRIEETLQVRTLAREVGLHPVSVARAVRRVHGCSVRRLIIHRRLARAAERLRATSLPLVAVADAAGFADQSHLTRLLRAESAFTPGALRRFPH